MNIINRYNLGGFLMVPFLSLRTYVCSILIALACASSIGSVRAIFNEDLIEEDESLLKKEDSSLNYAAQLANEINIVQKIMTEKINNSLRRGKDGTKDLSELKKLDAAELTQLFRYINNHRNRKNRKYYHVLRLLLVLGGIDLVSGARVSNWISSGGTFLDYLFTYMQLCSQPGETFSRKPLWSTINAVVMSYIGYKGFNWRNAMRLFKNMTDKEQYIYYEFIYEAKNDTI